jgi:hypothetical protein
VKPYKNEVNQWKSSLWKGDSGIGGKNLTNKHPFPQVNCLQILVESPSILSLQIFATGLTLLPTMTVLVLDKTRLPTDNHWPVVSHWQTYHIKLYQVQLVTLMVIGTDCMETTRLVWPQWTLLSDRMVHIKNTSVQIYD